MREQFVGRCHVGLCREMGFRLCSSMPRTAPQCGDLWGKPPDRGDTTPRHEPGTGREQSRNTPLGG